MNWVPGNTVWVTHPGALKGLSDAEKLHHSFPTLFARILPFILLDNVPLGGPCQSYLPLSSSHVKSVLPYHHNVFVPADWTYFLPRASTNILRRWVLTDHSDPHVIVHIKIFPFNSLHLFLSIVLSLAPLIFSSPPHIASFIFILLGALPPFLLRSSSPLIFWF